MNAAMGGNAIAMSMRSISDMKRTHYIEELSKELEGQTVVLAGWVHNYRKLGAIEFIDLRDKTGIVQLSVDDPEAIPDVRNEYVIFAKGVVHKKEVLNPKLPKGDIEIKISEIELLNKSETTPFIIADETDALEETRLQYRYLDLRRPKMLEYLKTRAKIARITRDYLDSLNFLEIETPILNLATPEGARDYLVPSRTRNGSFYALPQSPQLFKQLLMIGGTDRYYQIAKCFRDEDLRADRQPEFTQIDVECSFMSQDDILEIGEGLVKRYFKEILNQDVQLPLRRLSYKEALDSYGSDKPDTRYEMKIFDLAPVFKDIPFPAFEGESFIRGFIAHSYSSSLTRKKADELTMEFKKFRMKGLMYLKLEGESLTGSFRKWLSDEKAAQAIRELNLKDGDVLLFGTSHDYRALSFALGALRTKVAEELGLIDHAVHDILWVVDFPMFTKEVDEEGGVSYTAEHHPFTRPKDEHLKFLETEPDKVLAYAYDLIIDGYEAGGGTLRIYDHDTQEKIFKLLGLSEEEVRRKFGWFVDAFKYGAPPHGGFALGLERLTMVISNTDNIRNVVAFPKNLQAIDPMSKAPSPVATEALDAVGIQLKS